MEDRKKVQFLPLCPVSSIIHCWRACKVPTICVLPPVWCLYCPPWSWLDIVFDIDWIFLYIFATSMKSLLPPTILIRYCIWYWYWLDIFGYFCHQCDVLIAPHDPDWISVSINLQAVKTPTDSRSNLSHFGFCDTIFLSTLCIVSLLLTSQVFVKLYDAPFWMRSLLD